MLLVLLSKPIGGLKNIKYWGKWDIKVLAPELYLIKKLLWAVFNRLFSSFQAKQFVRGYRGLRSKGRDRRPYWVGRRRRTTYRETSSIYK